MNFKNRKIQSLLGISLAAILSVSMLSLVDTAEAEGEWKWTPKFWQPHFTATLADTSDDPENPNAPEGSAAKAKFWLSPDGSVLFYKIKTEGLDSTGFVTPSDSSDDITKLHLHLTQPGGHHPNPHVLNVAGAPIQDDNNLVLKPNKGIIRGAWDDGDVTPHGTLGPSGEPIGHHDASKKLSDHLENLCDGKLFTMIHGDGGPGILKGDIEPTKRGERLCDRLS